MISNRLLQHLIDTEKFRSKPYWDRKQYSIGYGTKARGRGDRVSESEARQRMRTHVGGDVGKLDARYSNLPPGIRDALISLSYNAGSGWMNKGLGKAVARGDYVDAKRRFLQYTKSNGERLPGLVNRRNAEAGWWNDKSPAGAAPASYRAAPGSYRAAQEVGMSDPLNNAPPMPQRNPQRVEQPPQLNTPEWHYGNGAGEEVSDNWSIDWGRNATPDAGAGAGAGPAAIGPMGPQEPAGQMQAPTGFAQGMDGPDPSELAPMFGGETRFSKPFGDKSRFSKQTKQQAPTFWGDKPRFSEPTAGGGLFGGATGFSKPFENPQSTRKKRQFGPFSFFRGYGR